jgi:hypothetical protein
MSIYISVGVNSIPFYRHCGAILLALLMTILVTSTASGQSENLVPHKINGSEMTRFLSQQPDSKTGAINLLKGCLEIIHAGDPYVDIYTDTKEERTKEDVTVSEKKFLYLRNAQVSAEDIKRLVQSALTWDIEEIWIDVCIIDGKLNFEDSNFVKRITFAGTRFNGPVHFERSQFSRPVCTINQPIGGFCVCRC